MQFSNSSLLERRRSGDKASSKSTTDAHVTLPVAICTYFHGLHMLARWAHPPKTKAHRRWEQEIQNEHGHNVFSHILRKQVRLKPHRRRSGPCCKGGRAKMITVDWPVSLLWVAPFSADSSRTSSCEATPQSFNAPGPQSQDGDFAEQFGSPSEAWYRAL